jgi:hypothetical protein
MNDMYLDEIEYFLECVRESRPTFNGIAEAAVTLDIALCARRDGAA